MKAKLSHKDSENDIFEKQENLLETNEKSLVTEDDVANNRKSLYRKLTNRLYLIVRKPREKHAWQFPQGGYEIVDGNELKKTAQRELKEECGKRLRVRYVGNCPMGHYCYPIENELRAKYDHYDRTKVFFFKALYISGTVTLNSSELVDYLWVTKQEMKEYFSPEFYDNVEELLRD